MHRSAANWVVMFQLALFPTPKSSSLEDNTGREQTRPVERGSQMICKGQLGQLHKVR